MTLFARVAALLEDSDAKDIVVVRRGIIPDGRHPDLEQLGVAKVFTPGATPTDIVRVGTRQRHPQLSLRDYRHDHAGALPSH
jgi:methylmalonyl-CoA mutase cobalamin-binding domain/chain